MGTIKQYFSELDLEALPANASEYIKKNLLTDDDLDLLDDNDEDFIAVKELIASKQPIETPAPAPTATKPSDLVLKMRLKAIAKLMVSEPNSVVLKMRIKAVNKLMSGEKMRDGGSVKWNTGAGVDVNSFLVGDEVYTNGETEPLGMVTSIGSKNVMVRLHKSNRIIAKEPTKLWVGKNIPHMENGGAVNDKIEQLYAKSNFINTDFNWKLKLLEMIQDQSIEAYNIYQSLNKAQKDEVLQEQYEMDNDMGSYGDDDIETSKENLEILLDDAKNGKKY